MDARVSEQLPAVKRAPDVSVYLPGNPRGKGSVRSAIIHKRDGSQFIAAYQDKETRSYEAELKFAAQAAMVGKNPLDCALRCRVTAVLAMPASKSEKWKRDALAGSVRPTTKPDDDNLLKIRDALKGIVFRDDSLFVESVTRKFYGSNPGLLIEIWRWTPPTLI